MDHQSIWQDRTTKKKIGRGSAQNGLFYLNADLDFNSAFSFTHCNKFDLWHSRLGHPSRSRFDFIVKNSPSIIANKDFVCDICPGAKQSRLSFSQSTSCSSHCFELIHVDIWGSFSIPSKNGSRFFLTIVDDYSRCTWIYLMKHKSETFNMLTKISRINSGNGDIFLPQLQTIRSDNGSEFLSKQIQTWFHDNGIIHQRSCISTP